MDHGPYYVYPIFQNMSKQLSTTVVKRARGWCIKLSKRDYQERGTRQSVGQELMDDPTPPRVQHDKNLVGSCS